MVPTAAGLIEASARMYAKRESFLVLFVFVFALNVFVLAQLNLLPAVAAVPARTEALATLDQAPVVVVAELPVKIEIPSITVAASIANPDTTDITALDKELLTGAVRYPTSAKLGETGNVVLFGHSSYLPVVVNKAYKTFNEIQKLHEGDLITVYASSTVYIYAVKSVSKESVNDNKPIPLSITGKELTLVTCNSFATKSDRFVVVADFVESHASR